MEKRWIGCLDQRYTDQQYTGELQFCWLGWQRCWFFLWHEQSSVNHDERTDY
jgi:hypothetical protein